MAKLVILLLLWAGAAGMLSGIEWPAALAKFSEPLASIDGRDITRAMVAERLSEVAPEVVVKLNDDQFTELIRKIVYELLDEEAVRRILHGTELEPSPELVRRELMNVWETLKLEGNPRLMAPEARDRLIERMATDPRKQFQVAALLWIRREFQEKLTMAPEEVENFYRENQQRFLQPAAAEFSLLVLPRSGEAAAQLQEKNRSAIDARLRQLESFESIATDYPQPGEAQLAVLRREPAVLDAVARLERDGSYAVLELPEAIVWVRLDRRRPAAYLPLEAVRESLRKELLAGRIRQAVNAAIARERAGMKITFFF